MISFRAYILQSLKKINISLFILVIILISESQAYTGEYIVLQSMRIKPYDLSFEGFKDSADKSVKRYILSEMRGADTLNIILKENPDLIYAIGADSLLLVRNLNIPIVYSTIFDPEKIVENRNIKGISMSLSNERILQELGKRLPDAKRIGYIKSSKEVGSDLKKAAERYKYKLVLSNAENSGEYIKALKKIRGKIDILLLTPNRALMSSEVLEFLFLTAMESRIKVVAFSGKYAQMGALLSLEPDLVDVGNKAFHLSEKIYSGKIPKNESLHASNVRVTVNLNVARILNIKPDEKLLNNAYIIK